MDLPDGRCDDVISVIMVINDLTALGAVAGGQRKASSGGLRPGSDGWLVKLRVNVINHQELVDNGMVIPADHDRTINRLIVYFERR